MYFVAHCDNLAPEEFAVYEISEEQSLNFLFGKEETLRYIKENNITTPFACYTLDEAYEVLECLQSLFPKKSQP